jgi:hypothetical protein
MTEKQEPMGIMADHLEKSSSLVEKDDPELSIENERRKAIEKSLVRKLDLTLVPMVWLLYLFNYLDRNNIAYVNLSPD